MKDASRLKKVYSLSNVICWYRQCARRSADSARSTVVKRALPRCSGCREIGQEIDTGSIHVKIATAYLKGRPDLT